MAMISHPSSITLLLVILYSLIIINHSKCEDELLSVIVIYRHGDRAPIRLYPTDPHNDPSLWPMGLGQLTKIGKRQQYDLGIWFRERYKNFLPKEFCSKDIYVRSTDVDRTLMSAECTLSGLYPPDANQTWNINLQWQPIPVHTIPETLDHMLAMKKPCDKYNQLYRSLYNTREFVEMQRNNHELYKYVSLNSGADVYNLETLQSIHNILFIEELRNLTLPNWTKKVYPDKMKPWSDMSFALYTYTSELALLRTGPLFDEIYQTLNNISYDALPKMHMYSAHDTTIADVLNTLKIFEHHSPPYSATILIELRTRDDGTQYVNVLYKNSTTPRKMKLKGCEFDCPLDRFFRILDRIRLPSNEWTAACDIKFLGMVPFGTLQTNVFLGCMGLLFILVCSFIVSLFWSKRRRDNINYLRIPNQEE